MGVSIEKIQKESPGLVDLAKKAQVSLAKHNLKDVTARVALVLDYSGSASGLYSRGTMQAAAEKVLAVATQFDDDGDIDVFLFHNDAWYAGSLNLSNYQGGIERMIKGKSMGGTEYGKAFELVTEHYFGGGGKRKLFGRNKSADVDTSVPVFVAFLTDGETFNEDHALRAAKASSEFPIFFQSVGMGSSGSFRFLSGPLNDHGGKVDNFGFFTTPDIAKMSDEDLLDGLLNEFPAALGKMRAAGTLA